MLNNDTIAKRCEELFLRDGKLTPEAVVEDAKSVDSPLHKLFEWDVKKAAYAHWIERAREVIRSIKITTTTERVTYVCPVYVHDPRAKSGEQSYVPLDTVRSEMEVAREIVCAEIRRAAAAITRAQAIAEVLGIKPDIDQLVFQLDEILERVGRAGDDDRKAA